MKKFSIRTRYFSSLLKVVMAIVELSLANAKPDDKFQFERHGHFVARRVDHAAGKLVFKLAVGLKDFWRK